MSMPYKINDPMKIDTEKLLLWPDNPRLKTHDFSERKYTIKQLINPANQKNIFDDLSKYENHDVHTLVQSMCRNGFMPEKAPTVMKIESVDRYLVLEGNRRLTAIKTIRTDQSLKIDPANRKSVESISCWLFVHTDKAIPLRAAISRFVAEAHIKGQKPHTKLQRAHMLYDSYEGILQESSTTPGFHLDDAALAATAEFFDLSPKELTEEISVVRLYKQFVAVWEFDDIPKKCSERLSWVHKNQRQFQIHFGYDPHLFCLDESDLDRFYDIFLHEEAAVTNPQTFRTFLNVMRKGTPTDIELIRENSDMLAVINQRIKEEISDDRFLTGLDGIETRLRALRLSDYRETMGEVNVARRIVDLVNGKLSRLISTKSDLSANGFQTFPDTNPIPNVSQTQSTQPTDIQEALLLDYSYFSTQIIKLVRSMPNSSCITHKVPTYLLQEWGLRSSGRPRAAFCDRVRKVVDQMVEEGLLDGYNTVNNKKIRV